MLALHPRLNKEFLDANFMTPVTSLFNSYYVFLFTGSSPSTSYASNLEEILQLLRMLYTLFVDGDDHTKAEEGKEKDSILEVDFISKKISTKILQQTEV